MHYRRLCTFLLSLILFGCEFSPSYDAYTIARLDIAQHCSNTHTEKTMVDFETNGGSFTLEIHPHLAPSTADNFLAYVAQGFYDNTLIGQSGQHYILNFGLMSTQYEYQEGERPPIKNESYNEVSHERGTVAMMRYNHPDSAKAEFFINLSHNKNLEIPNGYTVFATVSEGMDLLDMIDDSILCSRFTEAAQEHCQLIFIKTARARSVPCTQGG